MSLLSLLFRRAEEKSHRGVISEVGSFSQSVSDHMLVFELEGSPGETFVACPPSADWRVVMTRPGHTVEFMTKGDRSAYQFRNLSLAPEVEPRHYG